MRPLKIIIFAVALVALGAQLVHHTYVRWVEQRDSVVHRYEEPLDTEIRDASSLTELEQQYAQELKRSRTEARDNAASPEEGEESENSDPEAGARQDPDVASLRQAIQEWESQENAILELRYYWFCGLLALLAGAWALRSGFHWLGLALYILAFGEMFWWTTPSYFQGAMGMYLRLLDNKIIFTTLSLALLFAAWRWGGLRADRARSE